MYEPILILTVLGGPNKAQLKLMRGKSQAVTT